MRSTIREVGINMTATAQTLMVWPVQAVLAGASARDALQLMDRYRIGAVPVIDSDQVVGVLTHRLITGIIAHGLGDRPSHLFMMQIATVEPSAPLDDLFVLAVNASSRLIAVVDANRLCGVLTRTAILRAVACRTTLPDPTKVSLASLALLDRQILQKMALRAEHFSVALCLVGGCVRDLLLGLSPRDLDVMVEGAGTAIDEYLSDVKRELDATSHKASAFGTTRLEFTNGQLIDVATARVEYYAGPAALPSVAPGSLWLDLRRRDFTINSMAIRLDGTRCGELIDPFGGQADLRAGQLRILHGLSFIDDPTRIFRAIRFSARLQFFLEPQTLRLLQNALSMGLLDHVSSERLGNELLAVLEESHFIQSIRMIDTFQLSHYLRWSSLNSTLFQALERSDSAMTAVTESLAKRATLLPLLPRWIYRLAPLLYELCASERQSALARVGIRGKAADRVQHAAESWHRIGETGGLTNLGIVERFDVFEALGPDGWILAWQLCLEEEQRLLEQYLERDRLVPSPVSGHDLVRMGIAPGPAIKRLLTALRHKILEIALDADSAADWIQHRAKEEGLLGDGPS